LREAESQAVRLLAAPVEPPKQAPQPPPPPPPPPGTRVVEESRETNLDAKRAAAVLDELRAKITGPRRLSIQWRIEEPGGR
jgi:hypothetical protein